MDGPSAKWGMCGSKVVVVVGGGMGYRNSKTVCVFPDWTEAVYRNYRSALNLT